MAQQFPDQFAPFHSGTIIRVPLRGESDVLSIVGAISDIVNNMNSKDRRSSSEVRGKSNSSGVSGASSSKSSSSSTACHYQFV